MKQVDRSSSRYGASPPCAFRCLAQKSCSVIALAAALMLGAAGCSDGEGPPVASDPQPEAKQVSPTAPAVEASNAAANSVPRISSIVFEPTHPVAGGVVRAKVDVVDADGDPLFLHYEWEIEDQLVEEKTRSLALSGVSRGSVVSVTVTASDGVETSPPMRAEIRLANRAPRIERLSIFPSTEIVAGTMITATPEARDADGDPVEFVYEWRVNGKPHKEESAVFSTANLRRGDTLSVSVTASDGMDRSEPVETPELPIANAPPRIELRPGAPTTDGVFRYRVSAEDPDGDPDLQFHLQDAPKGMEIDALSGAITWVPQPDQIGSRIVSVVVDDLQGGRSMKRFEVTVDGE